jgi:hypothetical protein
MHDASIMTNSRAFCALTEWHRPNGQKSFFRDERGIAEAPIGEMFASNLGKVVAVCVGSGGVVPAGGKNVTTCEEGLWSAGWRSMVESGDCEGVGCRPGRWFSSRADLPTSGRT